MVCTAGYNAVCLALANFHSFYLSFLVLPFLRTVWFTFGARHGVSDCFVLCLRLVLVILFFFYLFLSFFHFMHFLFLFKFFSFLSAYVCFFLCFLWGGMGISQPSLHTSRL